MKTPGADNRLARLIGSLLLPEIVTIVGAVALLALARRCVVVFPAWSDPTRIANGVSVSIQLAVMLAGRGTALVSSGGLQMTRWAAAIATLCWILALYHPMAQSSPEAVAHLN